MLKIVFDESRASAEECASLRSLPGYAELLAALKGQGRQMGIDLMVIDRAQVTLAHAAVETSGTGGEKSDPKHDMPAGTWVVRKDNSDRPAIGKVHDAYVCMGELTLDIVLYSHDGTKIGRESPAMGGPRGYEPACGAENWEPIEKPNFDLLSTKGFWGRHVKRLRDPLRMTEET